MSTPFDAVIAGGGLSGLSLVAHLATGAWRDRRVLVVDDSTVDYGMPREPRTVQWGSWSAAPGLLDAAVSRTYRQVRVYAAGRTRVLTLRPYRYQVVRRPDLARVVGELVAGCPHFAMISGRVERMASDTDGVDVVVDGQAVRATWAFDSVGAAAPEAVPAARLEAVPAARLEAPVDARLAFTGWSVHCEQPVFDPDTPTLFDFRTAPSGRARFGYVLPDDPHRALVELTEFVPRHASVPTLPARTAALDDYLQSVLHCGVYTVERTESAVLPLRARPPQRCWGRVMAIGGRGGLLKASTGYAYQRIQRDSMAIAVSLAKFGHPFGVPSPSPRHRLLDAVLLTALDRNPAELERAFARLFRANPIDRVLRFLDEDSGLHDELHLIASLRSGPYLRALVALAARRWQGLSKGTGARYRG